MKKLKEQLQQYRKQQQVNTLNNAHTIVTSYCVFWQSDAAQIKSLKTELKTIAKAGPAAGGSAEDVSQLFF